MPDRPTPGFWDQTLERLLTAFAFVLPLSIALAQTTATLVLLAGVTLAVRRRSPLFWENPYFLPTALFAGVALLASIAGLRPEVSLPKCHRLLFYLLVFVVPFAAHLPGADPAARAARWVAAFVAGTCALGLYDLVRIPWAAAHGEWIFGLGNMRDPQFYMCALLFLVAAARRPRSGARSALYFAALVLCAAGLVLHFKRGVWFAFAGATLAMAVVTRRGRPVLAVALAAALLALLPAARERLGALQTEWTTQRGGRVDLWTRVAPGILRDHPWGIGLCATRNLDLRSYGPVAEAKLTHLHNNALQVALELGWVGLAVWVFWMLRAARIFLVARARCAPRGGPEAWVAAGLLASFAGLMLDGMVEYNFGDGEILMLLSLFMGLSVVLHEPGWRRPEAAAP